MTSDARGSEGQPAYAKVAVTALAVLVGPFAMLGFGWLIEQAIRAMGGS